MTDTCALGLFAVPGEGEGVPLSNVVEWSYELQTGTTLKLERREMRPDGLGPAEPVRMLESRDGKTIELFLRHVPPTGGRMHLDPDEPPDHWHMFFHLLHPQPSPDDVPRFRGYTTTERCFMRRGSDGFLNPGTLSCPVGKGDPP